MAGCSSAPEQKATADERYEAARRLFEQTSRDAHLQAAAATGRDKERLLNEAAAGYNRIVKDYSDQTHWAAQALRSLGNVRAEQGDTNAAVRIYARVDKEFPDAAFEVLMAWKSAADLLWDAGRKEEAVKFYTKIVDRYSGPGNPSIIQTIVGASRRRLNEAAE